MATEHPKSLEERITDPVVSKDIQRKITLLEREFHRVDVEQLRQTCIALRPLFAKRSEIITDPEVFKDFWLRVLSNAPGEIDEYITSADAAILNSCLKNFIVERFELNEWGEGEPRSIRLIFEFHENEFFEDLVIVKTFHWRRQEIITPSGKTKVWEGLVSEPSNITWKKDMDITSGLLAAACKLFEAEKKHGGDRKQLPEFKELVEKIALVEAAEMEQDSDDEYKLQGQTSPSMSFFNFFGYRGSDVTAEQSAAAIKKDNEKFEKILKGEAVEENEADEADDDVDDFDAIEIFPDGNELAIALADDLWANALKYYVQSFDVPPDFDEDVIEVDLPKDGKDGKENEDDDESRPRKKAKV